MQSLEEGGRHRGTWGTDGHGGDGAQGTPRDTGIRGTQGRTFGANGEWMGTGEMGLRGPPATQGPERHGAGQGLGYPGVAQPFTWELGRLLGTSSGCPRSGLQVPVFWNISWARWVTQD